jgi:hypothetical protein
MKGNIYRKEKEKKLSSPIYSSSWISLCDSSAITSGSSAKSESSSSQIHFELASSIPIGIGIAVLGK